MILGSVRPLIGLEKLDQGIAYPRSGGGGVFTLRKRAAERTLVKVQGYIKEWAFRELPCSSGLFYHTEW